MIRFYDVTYRIKVSKPAFVRARHPSYGIRNGDKKECKWGHPYTPENTYRRPDTGARMCRKCRK